MLQTISNKQISLFRYLHLHCSFEMLLRGIFILLTHFSDIRKMINVGVERKSFVRQNHNILRMLGADLSICKALCQILYRIPFCSKKVCSGRERNPNTPVPTWDHNFRILLDEYTSIICNEKNIFLIFDDGPNQNEDTF